MRLPSRLETAIRDISMRNYYLLLWVLLFVEGVSGDGNEEVEVSVTKGDSITLPGFPGVQKTDQIVWKFGVNIIFQVEEAERVFKKPEDGIFKDKVHLDKTTGALTITQVTSEHAGRYQLDINKKKNSQSKKFRFSVYDKPKTVSVMEGDSVTLNSDSTQMQGIILIQWWFGASGSVIAQTDGNETSYPYLTEIFGGRLQLDNQTGSLTINNMRTKHSGLYKLEVKNNTGMISSMAFSVTVYESPSEIGGEAEMKSVSVKKGDSVTLQTDVTETHGDELIVWRFGDKGKLIAKCDKEANISTLYETEERFRDRLKLNNQTGSLTITNITTAHSEIYTVKISSRSKQTIYKRFNVTFSVPDKPAPVSGLSSGAVAGIVVVLLLLVFIVAGVIYHRHKISELEGPKDLEKNGTNVPLNAETANSDAS